MKVVTDNIGKDDTCQSGTPGTTDVGTIARLAYAELLRCQTTPIVGTFTTPIIPTALPGQLVHVHAKKKKDGSFNIDSNFRITAVIHSMTNQGFLTRFDVTDDVTNSHPRSRFGDINKVLAAARPEFQDRQASSIKMPELDITQTVLEEDYP